MPCYHPLHGYRARGGTVVFQRRAASFPVREATVACGQCWGCRLERSKQWAIRCVHEAQLHEEKCFITLTLRDEELHRRYQIGWKNRKPVYGGSLLKKQFQDFMKRMRIRFPRALQYFHCGEYGERWRRPHYHALVFGRDFSDKAFYKNAPDGSPLFTSSELEELWGLGFCTIGAVTFESAAYVARYIMKKVSGDTAGKHYRGTDIVTGEQFDLEPEYVTMSLRRPIGKAWFDLYRTDVYPDDFVVVRGVKMKPPRYYDRKLKEVDEALERAVKARREAYRIEHEHDQTPERLAVREEVSRSGISTLKLRSLE